MRPSPSTSEAGAGVTRRSTAQVDRFCALLGLTVGLAAFAIAVLVAYSVVAREFFSASDVGIIDISTYLMAYITFVGAAYGIWAGAHVGVHIVTSQLRGRALAIVTFVANALLSIVAAVFAWVSAGFWIDAWRSGEQAWGTLSIPMWIPYSSMLVGTVLFVVLQVARMFLGRADHQPSHRDVE
jgi:TRAP-type C4-dicarboxylate transport system permease small subunit